MSPEFLYPFHNCPPQSPMPIHINRFRIIKSNLFNTYIIVILKFISDIPYSYVVVCLYGFSLFIQRCSNWAKSRYHICHFVKGKVKCTLVQELRLCTGCTAQRGGWGIALPFLDHGTRRGWGVSVTPRPLFTPGKESVPIVQEAVCVLVGRLDKWLVVRWFSGWLNTWKYQNNYCNYAHYNWHDFLHE
jgi:hypothetical protein